MPDRSSEPPFDPRDPRYDPRIDPRDPRYDPRYDPAGGSRGDWRGDAPPQRRSRMRTLVIAAVLLGLLLAALFTYRLTRAGPGEDRLEDAGANSTASAATGEERCGSQRSYDLVKRELFRRAAQLRGTDQAAFDRLSAYATVRVSDPVLKRQDEELRTLVCGGNVALDLPPGVAVVGGRRTLSASLDYALQPAADGSGDVVTLSNADPIVVPLATLARTGSRPSLPQDQRAPDAPASEPSDVSQPLPPGSPPVAPPPQAFPPADRAPDRVPPPPAMEVPSASARPSFNCARARTRGEIAVCNSAELAALDREMAGFYRTAYRGADPQARATLERTRNRFLGYRDRCRTDRCIADAYRGRISEIRDIVDGRWRAP